MARHYDKRWYRKLVAQVKATRPPCGICGQPGADTLDHIVPLVAGGAHSPDNLQPAHRSCNSRKGGRRPRSYRAPF